MKNPLTEDRSERNGCLYILLPITLIVLIILGVLLATGLIRFESDSKSEPKAASEAVKLQDSAEEVIASSSYDFVVTENEWRELQQEVQQLRDEIDRLKRDNTKPAATRQNPPTRQTEASTRLPVQKPLRPQSPRRTRPRPRHPPRHPPHPSIRMTSRSPTIPMIGLSLMPPLPSKTIPTALSQA